MHLSKSQQLESIAPYVRATYILSQVPLRTIFLHDKEIVDNEALLCNATFAQTTISDINQISINLFHLSQVQHVSPCDESNYAPRLANNPEGIISQLPPRSTRTTNKSLSDSSYKPYLRGGGGKVIARKVKNKRKKSIWDNPNLMDEDTSILYDSKHRNKIQVSHFIGR
jgi:hypothetical protein